MSAAGDPDPQPTSGSLREALENIAGRHGVLLRGIAGGVALLTAALVGVWGWFLLIAAVAVAVGVLLEIGERRWMRREAVRREAAAVANQVAAARAETAAARQAVQLAGAGLQKYTLLVDTLDDIARGLAAVALRTPAKRQAEFGRFAKACIDAVLLVNKDIPGLRVVIFHVQPGRRAMTVLERGSQGHRRAPRPFTRGNDRGDRAFQTLAGREVLFVENIHDAPEIWGGSGTGYETFVTCPLFADNVEYGLLTVDAPFTDDLTEDDKNGLRLAGEVISLVFALCGG